MARHCVASTSRTWVVPMPKAMAPRAPWVEVWLSPQAMGIPGWLRASSGPITWTMPCLPLPGRCRSIAAMNCGVWLPTCRHLATPDIIRGAAVRAEQLGYDSVWVSDHVVVPHANIVNFGETVFAPLVTLAVVAGATRRVRLGTTVLIVPYRNAVVTAKMIASLDP